MRRFKVMENTGKPAAPAPLKSFRKFPYIRRFRARMLPEEIIPGNGLFVQSLRAFLHFAHAVQIIAFGNGRPLFAISGLMRTACRGPYLHLKWIEWIKDRIGIEITFPVIADPLGELAALLGMIRRIKAQGRCAGFCAR